MRGVRARDVRGARVTSSHTSGRRDHEQSPPGLLFQIGAARGPSNPPAHDPVADEHDGGRGARDRAGPRAGRARARAGRGRARARGARPRAQGARRGRGRGWVSPPRCRAAAPPRCRAAALPRPPPAAHALPPCSCRARARADRAQVDSQAPRQARARGRAGGGGARGRGPRRARAQVRAAALPGRGARRGGVCRPCGAGRQAPRHPQRCASVACLE